MTSLSQTPIREEDLPGPSSGGAEPALWWLLALQTIAVIMQATAVCIARQELGAAANVLSCTAFGVAFASALWALTVNRLSRKLRNIAVLCFGVTSAIQWKMSDPLVHLGYDEQLHMRTLRDIEAAQRLFEPQPLLAVSPRYPGLEALTGLLMQIGLPPVVATEAVVLLARIILVTALCAAVEYSTGSARTGGLAVAVYAVSPQFVFFNSQFSYQTLSLPFALSAVALVARVRGDRRAAPLFGGVAICLLAVAVTHHLTSLLTAIFLVCWAVLEQPGRPRRRVALAAVIAVLVAALWATIQWSLLRDYFGPMITGIADELRLGHRREPFAETAGSPKPWWERALLGYYAVVIVTGVGYLTLNRGRMILRDRRRCPVDPSARRWRRQALVVGIAVMIPLMFGARVVPRFGEVGDRASTFTYLAFAVLAAVGLERCHRCVTQRVWSSAKHREHQRWRRVIGALGVRTVATVLATGVFVGGYLLGSGAAWARLPGPYLPGADGRSVDAEMLAVTRWAGGALPAGSRVAADRMTSTLLASRAGLWPLSTQPDGFDLASLYQANEWGPPQTEMARQAHLRYVFTDERIVGKKPYDLGYFDETTVVSLTAEQIAKFGSVPGIVQIYRHGPIGVYDLRGLGIADQRTGWTGTTGSVGPLEQMVVGFSLGVAGALIWRSDLGAGVIRVGRVFRSAAGSSLTLASTAAALCVLAIALLLMQIWLGPVFFGAAVVGVTVVNPVQIAARISAWRGWRARVVLPAALVAGSVSVVVAMAAWDADQAHRLGPGTTVIPSTSTGLP